jgi:hypothetical protein
MFSFFKRRPPKPASARELFEAELRRRGISFSIDGESQRHCVQGPEGELLVSLDNLERDLAYDRDEGRVARFVDVVLAPNRFETALLSLDQIFWGMEPADHVEKADFRVALSDRVERVLQHLSRDQSTLTWLTPEMLAEKKWSRTEVEAAGFCNLARELAASKLEFKEIDGVRLGFISPTIPLKSSLMLAPNLREFTAATLGWPLLAVAPHRDFLYLWAAEHKDFAGRVGHVVVREFGEGSYPLSTEVWAICETGVKAIGEFPTGK